MAAGPETGHRDTDAITRDLDDAVKGELGERGKYTGFNTFLTGDDEVVVPSRVLLAKAIELPGLRDADSAALHGLIICAMGLGGQGTRAADELARAFGEA